ncbi:MAG: transcription termination factor Rho [Propionibacteriales bacterium]|nr:transcription termination factor Rho [Propionibacteriales bacterium]
MTETTESAPAAKGGLSAMLLPELKKVAGGLGIKATGLKKAELVAAIKAAQGGGARRSEPVREKKVAVDVPPEARAAEKVEAAEPQKAEAPQTADDGAVVEKNRNAGNQNAGNRGAGNAGNQNAGNQNNQNNQNAAQGDDGEGGSRRNRRRRGRDRDRVVASGGQTAPGAQGSAPSQQGGAERRSNRNEPDLQILEDDVLAPCAGILDVLDSYAFVRTSGYMPGTDDVYVSLSTVRKYGLRRGDAIVGQVRQPREGDRKEKFNPLVKIDSINGGDPEAAKTRVEFSKLTPLHPSERLRMETTPTNLVGRIIDIVAPIGKGQRGLIVSPAKAGKTMVLQSIANSITTNNPECHLMVVLVDERPEEVTDFERSVNGEVISSTFDRPATDHTMVAELAIERAKRLVELGHDVVVLLDGITRLGRAYNLALPPSGRILSGGVDSAALFPPKKFFGAARNIEDGGSLTILATALVESGSKIDEVIFEEFTGTPNMELRLRSEFAEKRIFPAIDAVGSGTRREEELMSAEELAIIWNLRRELSGTGPQQAVELLLERLAKSQTNLEFLMQVQRSTPVAGASVRG